VGLWGSCQDGRWGLLLKWSSFLSRNTCQSASPNGKKAIVKAHAGNRMRTGAGAGEPGRYFLLNELNKPLPRVVEWKRGYWDTSHRGLQPGPHCIQHLGRREDDAGEGQIRKRPKRTKENLNSTLITRRKTKLTFIYFFRVEWRLLSGWISQSGRWTWSFSESNTWTRLLIVKRRVG